MGVKVVNSFIHLKVLCFRNSSQSWVCAINFGKFSFDSIKPWFVVYNKNMSLCCWWFQFLFSFLLLYCQSEKMTKKLPQMLYLWRSKNLSLNIYMYINNAVQWMLYKTFCLLRVSLFSNVVAVVVVSVFCCLCCWYISSFCDTAMAVASSDHYENVCVWVFSYHLLTALCRYSLALHAYNDL